VKSYILEEMAWVEVRPALKKASIVLVPIGSTEQHGLHLPLGTDHFLAAYLAQLVAEELGGIVTPTICFGYSANHMRFAGTISISGGTLKALVTEVCESLISHGVKKLVLLNAHGGNVGILTSTVQELNTKFPEAKVLSLFWLEIINQEVFSLLEQDLGTHADEVETSLMLKAKKDLVHMDQAKREIPEGLPDDVRMLRKYLGQGVISLQQISKNGALGDPSLASVQKGEQIQEIAKHKIIEAIQGAFGPIQRSTSEEHT